MTADLDRVVRDVFAATTGFEMASDTSFFEAGVTSPLLVSVHEQLQRQLGREFPLTVFFKYPNRRALVEFLAGTEQTVAGSAVLAEHTGGWTARSRRELRSRIRQGKG